MGLLALARLFDVVDKGVDHITTNIMAEVLKQAGYNVELVQADYIAQFAGLESGDLHVAMEMWETTGKQAMDASLATGKTVDLGETGMDAKEEWWYPMYMKDRCPGLPDWKALNDCAEAFSTPETAPRGRYLVTGGSGELPGGGAHAGEWHLQRHAGRVGFAAILRWRGAADDACALP